MAQQNGPVEKKVTMATVAAAVTSAIVLWILATVPALQAWADIIQTLVGAAVVAVLTFLVGFWTKHTARNDVATRRTGTSDPGVPPIG
jgi:fatty acid desaturase